jgi:TorA maturation chaperone TorD
MRGEDRCEFFPEEQDFSKLEQQLKEDAYKETINLLSDLQVKFMRMFVRPGSLLAAPYESVYRKDLQRLNLQGLLMGSCTT